MTKLERLNELYSDPKMAQKLNAAPTEEDLRLMLAENGVEFTPEEMSGILSELASVAEQAFSNEELSEEQLESVSGGFSLSFAIPILGKVALKATGSVATALGVSSVVGIGIGLAGLAVYAVGKRKKWW